MHMEQTATLKIILKRGLTDKRELVWDVSVYGKTRYVAVVDLFREINGYWSYITEERREAIWNIYVQIHKTLYEIADPTQQVDRLILLVAKLYEQHPLNEIYHWTRFHGDVKYPDTLKEVCDPDDIVARTYLRPDYVWLVAMAIALRPMVPIFGEYILRARDEAGSDYKEYAAFKLLAKSHIISCAAMERLKVYVMSAIESEADSITPTLNGLGTSELPDWLLAMTVVRRVAPGDISVQDEKTGNLITNIHAFVSGALKDLDRKFGGAIREKYREDYGDDDDSMSFAEMFKVRQKNSIGDVALYSVYTENPTIMAMKIDPTIDVSKVHECLLSTSRLTEMEIRRNHHLVLVQWVINKVIPARGAENLNKQAILRAMATTQALLWHWGMPELAILATADVAADDAASLMVIESRSRIPADLQKTLNDLYPYTENAGRSKGQSKNANVAVKNIQALAKEMSVPRWVINAPAALIQECPLIDKQNRMITPLNIMELIARLVIKLHLGVKTQ